MLSPHLIPFLQHFWVDINCEWMVTKVLSRKEGVKNPDKYFQKYLNMCTFLCDWILKLKGTIIHYFGLTTHVPWDWKLKAGHTSIQLVQIFKTSDYKTDINKNPPNY